MYNTLFNALYKNAAAQNVLLEGEGDCSLKEQYILYHGESYLGDHLKGEVYQERPGIVDFKIYRKGKVITECQTISQEYSKATTNTVSNSFSQCDNLEYQ